jgi:hypothetical protein
VRYHKEEPIKKNKKEAGAGAFLLKGTKYSKRTLLLPERRFTDDGRTGSHKTA